MIYHPEDTDSRRISKLEARLAKLEKKLRQMPLESSQPSFRYNVPQTATKRVLGRGSVAQWPSRNKALQPKPNLKQQCK